MKLSITIEGGMIQSVDADEPVDIAICFFGDDMSDLRDDDGEQTYKSFNGDDCCIHVIGEGQTDEEREHAARIYDHAIKQVIITLERGMVYPKEIPEDVELVVRDFDVEDQAPFSPDEAFDPYEETI